MNQGSQTWVFANKPTIIGSAAVGGPHEARGPLAQDFDVLHEDLHLSQSSFEKAERKLLEEACDIAIRKAKLEKQAVQYFLSGDLLNQIVSSSFAARTLAVPYLGVFGACSTSMEALALGALIVDSGKGNNVLCGAVSHNSAVEKQFRYPTEYGSQKPATAQWTNTGAGTALLANTGDGPQVTSATIGKIVDMAITDPFNMGAAMAPAAVDTISAHFRDLEIDHNAYDLILTGDLGRVGHVISLDLFDRNQIDMPAEKYRDCGIMIYDKIEPMAQAGASGTGCSAVVTYGHILNEMRAGKLKRVLVVATGALLSPLTSQQNETIPCIAHAVAIEYNTGA